MKEKTIKPARQWSENIKRRHSLEAEFYSELRCWVQHAILEAEKRGNFEKKDQLLSLLREL